MITLDDLRFFCRKAANSGEGIRIKSQASASGFVDTQANGVQAAAALVKFYHADTTTNSRLFLGSTSASTTLYASATALPTAVSNTAVTTSGWTAYLVDLRSGVKRYLRMKLSSSAAHVQGAEVILINNAQFPASNLGMRALTRIG